MNPLYQHEAAIDDLLARWHNSGDNQTCAEEWARIRDGIQEVCRNMFEELGNGENNDDVRKDKEVDTTDQEVITAKRVNNEEVKQIQMFEKGRRMKKSRQPVEEDPNDDE